MGLNLVRLVDWWVLLGIDTSGLTGECYSDSFVVPITMNNVETVCLLRCEIRLRCCALQRNALLDSVCIVFVHVYVWFWLLALDSKTQLLYVYRTILFDGNYKIRLGKLQSTKKIKCCEDGSAFLWLLVFVSITRQKKKIRCCANESWSAVGLHLGCPFAHRSWAWMGRLVPQVH